MITKKQRGLLNELEAAAMRRADADASYRAALLAAAHACGYAEAAAAAGTSRQAVRQAVLLMRGRSSQAPAPSEQKARGDSAKVS